MEYEEKGKITGWCITRPTKASESKQVILRGMLERIKTERLWILRNCKCLLGDRGYDGITLIKELGGEEICPVIDICSKYKNVDYGAGFSRIGETIVYHAELSH